MKTKVETGMLATAAAVKIAGDGFAMSERIAYVCGPESGLVFIGLIYGSG